MNKNYGGGMRSRDRSRLTGGPGGDVRLLTTLSGTLEKGGPSFILEFTNRVHGNPGHDKVQSYFVNSSSSTITIPVNLVSTESYDQEESNGAGFKEFGGELIEDVGFYRRINQSALIKIINTFYSCLCLPWPLLPNAKGSYLVLNRFQWDLESF